MSGIGEERRCGITVKRGDAGLRDVVDDVALLLFERGGHGEHAFDKATAGRTVGAKAALAPQHGGAQRALGGVVRGLDAGDLDEGPERRRQGQQGPAGRRRLGRGKSSGDEP